MIFPLVILVFGNSLAVKDGQDSIIKNEVDAQDKSSGGRLFIGGSKLASIKEAPYVVALVKNVSNGPAVLLNVPFCSGSIITEEWVLSAAHCIRKVVPVTLFQVIAGCDTAAVLQNHTGDDDLRQSRSPVDWQIHPQYQYHPGTPDIPNAYDALLIKVEPFIFGDAVNRIGLWAKKWEGAMVNNPDKHKRFLSSQCSAYGWGQKLPNEDDYSTYDLRTSTFTVIQGIGGCSCMDDDQTRRMICTVPTSGSSICPGDGGGPLVCQNLLAGFAYYIFRCRKNGKLDQSLTTCGGENVISAWVYVCRMLSWIYHLVPGTPPPPTSCRSSLICGPSYLLAEFLLVQLVLCIHQ